MTAPRRRTAIAGLAAALCLGVVACGSDSGDDAGKRSSIRIGSSMPDNYDPVLFQTTQATEPLQLVYTGLVTYKHAEGAAGTQVVPGLAKALPTISADNKTYVFKLRPGLRYSDGSPVVASDFEHTIKRLNHLGGMFASFTSSIAGIAEYRKAKRPDADISGITSDDAAGTITVKLSDADGTFLNVIALPAAAPTPAAKSPFKGSRTIPGIGPYTIDVVDPARRFVLTKTPGFDLPGIARGNIDTITVTKGTVPRITQDVIDGRLDYMTEDPAGDLLPRVRAKYPDRFRTDANPPNTYWYFLNHSIAPFSSLAVRKAANYAIDSRALQRVFGGLMEPTCNFLPPAYADIGYRRIDPCPYGDPAGPGDVAKARQLVDASGHKGEHVTVWGFSSDPVPQATEYLRDVLTRIGLQAKTRIIEQKVYFATVGARHTKAQAGLAAYFQDFPHPADFLGPLLSTSALASDPTSNFQMQGNPDVDRALEQLGPQSDPAKAAGGWARADRSVIEHADVAVFGNQLSTTFFSPRMNAKACSGVHPVYKHDWSLFCLK